MDATSKLLVMMEHEQRLRRFLRRSIPVDHEVDDYVQDVYLRVLQSVSGSNVENPWGFLRRVASNVLIDHVRKRRARMADYHVPSEEAANVPSGGASPEQTTLDMEQMARLRRALQSLSPQAQQIFQLVRVDGLTHKEAGALLNLPAKTVSKSIERSLARLSNDFMSGADNDR
jgi:RNA polymerase sigma-70 factor (ECF subfamily)